MHRRRGIFERAKQLALQGVRIGSCVPVVAEIAFGIELSSSRDRNFQRLIGVLPTLTIWPFDKDSTLTYGRIAAVTTSWTRSRKSSPTVKRHQSCLGLDTDGAHYWRSDRWRRLGPTTIVFSKRFEFEVADDHVIKQLDTE